MRKLILPLVLFAVHSGLQAQDTAAQVPMASEEQVNQVILLAFTTIVVLLFVVIILALSIQTLIHITLYPNGKPEEAGKPSWWARFKGSAPAPGQVMDRDIGHEYDGITELDNDMPPWFKFLFYVTIAFAFVYMLNYHVFKWTPLQEEEYTQEMQAAEAELAVIREKQAMSLNEDNIVALTDASGISSGKTIYDQNCAVCHGKAGEGLVGPNLTDEFWLHGGGIKNVFKVVKNGVPEKGMIAWQDQLNPLQMQQVSSFILSLQGTNPAGGKEPQGDKWNENTASVPATETTTDTTTTTP